MPTCFSQRTLMILCLLLAACNLPTPPPPPAPTPPPPVMQVWDGARLHRISSEGSEENALLDAFFDLVHAVRQRARTFYPPPRFDEEVAIAPYFLAEFPVVTTLQGQGVVLQARRVVVTWQQGELLLLVQTEDDSDWSVYLTGDTDAERQFLDQLLATTGVQLAPD